jgi:formamidopyrimidine-DNA glycosylase
MPELPEVETVVRGLQSICGKKISRISINRAKLVSVGSKTLSPTRQHTQVHVRAFKHVVQGRRIISISRRAKLIQIKLSGGWWLFIHLKMSGQIILQRRNQRHLLVRLMNTPKAPLETLPNKHTHIIIQFSDGTWLFYNDTRLFGTWRAVADNDLSKLKDLSKYGPEPLDRNFSVHKLKNTLMRRPNMRLKQALTDQELLAGVGNIYADETLYRAKLLPTRNVKSLLSTDWLRLLSSLKQVLKSAIHHHGSSIGDYIRPDGSMGDYGHFHKVYGRAGESCKVCKTKIRRIVIGGRSTHYCPKCQV